MSVLVGRSSTSLRGREETEQWLGQDTGKAGHTVSLCFCKQTLLTQGTGGGRGEHEHTPRSFISLNAREGHGKPPVQPVPNPPCCACRREMRYLKFCQRQLGQAELAAALSVFTFPVQVVRDLLPHHPLFTFTQGTRNLKEGTHVQVVLQGSTQVRV